MSNNILLRQPTIKQIDNARWSRLRYKQKHNDCSNGIRQIDNLYLPKHIGSRFSTYGMLARDSIHML